MNNTTKLKLLVPLFYCAIANIFFVFSVDDGVDAYQPIGWFLTDAAFVLWIIARVQLGNAFTIAPRSKYLVKSGLYSKLRHPVYYFSILAVMGLSVFLWNIFAFIALLALVALEVFRIQKEEVLLEKAFGEEYLKYKQETWF